MQRRVSALLIAVLAAATAACSSSGSSTPSKQGQTATAGSSSKSKATSDPKGSITIYAASSLTEAFNTLKAAFMKAHPGTKVTTTYGASSALATQIAQSAPVDVFASASPTNMDSVVRAGQAINPVNFVSNSLEIAVPKSNPGKITSIKDLAKAGKKIAVCAPAVPCGAVAVKVFGKAKISVRPTASLADVKSTLAAVSSGNADAGLVYVTDVRAAGSKVTGIKIDPSVNASTEYPIVALKNAKNPPLAKEWVDFVLSAAGKKVLTQDGFAAP